MNYKKCKLCGGEFKSLEMHLTTCLKKYNITREAYEVLDTDPTLSDSSDELAPVTIPEKQEGVVTPVQAVDRVFKVGQRDPNRPLSEALQEFNITEHELISILKKWKGEGNVPLEMRIKQRMSIGEELAKQYEGKTSAEVSNPEAAEVLVKNYGFKCIEVRSPKGTTPKTWVLKKL